MTQTVTRFKLFFTYIHLFWKSSLFIPVALATVTLALLSPVLLFHNTSFFVNLDNVDQFYTWYQKLATSWHYGYLPIWNANVYSGQSFAGELQPGVLYPLNWLWLALFGSVQGISEAALNYLVAAHFWIAAYGVYLLTKQMGAERWAAFLAGLTFAFSGAVAFRAISQTVIFFGLALLPYSLYFLIRYHTEVKKRRRLLVAAGIFVGVLLLVGHIQPFFHALVAIAFIQVVHMYQTWKKQKQLLDVCIDSAKTMAVVLGSMIVIAAPQLWISLPYLSDTYRVQASGYVGSDEKIDYGDFSKSFNIDMHEFANLIDPVSYPIRDGNNIFIGLAPLVVIVIACFALQKKFKKTELWQRYGLLVKALLLFSFIAMLGYVTWFAAVLYELPFVYQIRQLGRYAILFDLGLMIVFAAGLPVVIRAKLTPNQARTLTILGIYMLINAAYLFALRKHIFGVFFAFQVALLSLSLLTITHGGSLYRKRALLIAIVITTAAVNTLWFLPRIQSDTKVTSAYTLSRPLTTALSKTNGQYRIEDVDGALPLNVGNVYPVQSTGGYSATIYGPYFRAVHQNLAHKELLRDLLGVQLLASKQVPKTGQEVIYSDPVADVYVIKRPSALAKFFTVAKNSSTHRGDYQSLEVKTLTYTDQQQKFVVTAPKEQTVIISEMYYPGWQATIDGKPASLEPYTINGEPLLKSIKLPAGTHTIELLYKPFVVF